MPDRVTSWSSILEWIGLLAPPAFGALIGMRYAKDQTLKQRGAGFLTAFFLSVYMTPALAEAVNLGPKATVAAGILVAIVGMDIVGALIATIAQLKNDPMGTIKGWVDMWLGRGK
jgi:hypothetical protein